VAVVDGLSFLELARSTRSHPETLADVLREEIAAGRMEEVRNGRVEYRLTDEGRRQLEPLLGGLEGLAAITEPR
jgi:DNA-binding HxlR family transcriptional regulator